MGSDCVSSWSLLSLRLFSSGVLNEATVSGLVHNY